MTCILQSILFKDKCALSDHVILFHSNKFHFQYLHAYWRYFWWWILTGLGIWPELWWCNLIQCKACYILCCDMFLLSFWLKLFAIYATSPFIDLYLVRKPLFICFIYNSSLTYQHLVIFLSSNHCLQSLQLNAVMI